MENSEIKTQDDYDLLIRETKKCNDQMKVARVSLKEFVDKNEIIEHDLMF